MPFIDLNCDLGEGGAHDAELMALISSASIACGGHAGNVDTMRATMALAHRSGVAAGAHPGFEDPAGFGRKERPASAAEVGQLVDAQVRALLRHGALAHVKPHGALYNQASADRTIADAVAGAVRAIDPRLAIFAPAESQLARAAQAGGLRVVREFFADRGYLRTGALVPRGQPGALVADPDEAVARVLRMLEAGTVPTADGGELRLGADSVCLHGDRPGAAGFARAIRSGLERGGWTIKRPETA